MHKILSWPVCLSLLLSTHLHAASLDNLVAHRALYELRLNHADDKTGINHLSGRMVYEFSGSRCAGFTTTFRYVSRIEVEESMPRLNDQQTILFESGDGNELHIINKNYIERELSYQLEAKAQKTETGIEVNIIKPEAKKHHLATALFPTSSMLEMLQNAEDGINFYQSALYDDFETGDKITQSTAVIGAARKIEGGDDLAWPVTVSYFDDAKNPDGYPSYSSRFLLDEKGISRDIVFNYGDFSMRATLTQLDMLEASPCID